MAFAIPTPSLHLLLFRGVGASLARSKNTPLAREDALRGHIITWERIQLRGMASRTAGNHGDPFSPSRSVVEYLETHAPHAEL
ncbi:hypothetical protein FB45DRAFT_244174 [Roridomyces roridus]|uniref:Uncharacterized protein n=1 Tax=Roridomyces roridus TaxID=1738132 RepID=A0AAD7BBA7_9AGAR|nr:hypothetical protein FB45DRAFT_244174 [Roridomyces roridus]